MFCMIGLGDDDMDKRELLSNYIDLKSVVDDIWRSL